MSSKLIISIIGTVALVVMIIAAIGLLAGRFLDTDSMTVADLKSENDQMAVALATAQAEITNLKEVNARLQADIAGGRSVEEERRALQTRSQEMDRREQNTIVAEKKLIEQETKLQQDIAAAEERIREREAKLRQSEQEFYEATNLTQQEIGQAKQVQTEYEAMRQSRDEAQGLANQWLVFIWGVSISAFVLLLILVVMIMRYWTVVAKHRAETEQRRHAVALMSATLSSTIPPEQKASLLSALNGFAGIPEGSSVEND